LEKLTGAYVAIYTARYVTQFLNVIYREPERQKRFYRPENVGNRHRLFVSDNLQNAGSILAERISGALDDINATAIQVARITQPAAAPSRKKARTLDSDESPDAEQGASSLTKKDAGPSPEDEPNIYAHGVEYENALGAASARGQETVVRLLLDHGVDVNAEWGNYGTALYAASQEGHEKIVILLLSRNADVNITGRYHRTALDAASFRGHENIARLLLANGADIEPEYRRSALVQASAGGHQEIVSLLLNKGADIDARSKFEQSDIDAWTIASRINVGTAL